jgi:hypothetical protein
MAMTSKVDFTKKVRRSMRDLQNDARKIISLSREFEHTYGRINKFRTSKAFRLVACDFYLAMP